MRLWQEMAHECAGSHPASEHFTAAFLNLILILRSADFAFEPVIDIGVCLPLFRIVERRKLDCFFVFSLERLCEQIVADLRIFRE